MAQTVTLGRLHTFAELVYQPMTLESRLEVVATYARGIEYGYIIIVLVDTEVFGTKPTIYLECNDLERFVT